MARTKTKALVREYLEGGKAELLEQERYRPIVARMIKGHAGIYALYNRDQLYYVGLASNMMSRVNHHLRDRHHGKWDRFSVYLTSVGDHVRPLEALILRIVAPKGNRVKGTLRSSKDLHRELKREMREADNDSRAVLLGERAIRGRRKRKTRGTKGSTPLAGLIERRIGLQARYKGKVYRASLRRDGYIQYGGELYDSPTGAAKTILKRPVNGWVFWQFKRRRGQWEPLGNLRR